MTKIGIATFWWSDDNYGQLLQAYALATYLNSLLNTSAELIPFKNPDAKTSVSQNIARLKKVLNFKKLFGYVVHRLANESVQILERNKLRNFSEFREKYLPLNIESKLSTINLNFLKFSHSNLIWAVSHFLEPSLRNLITAS